MFRFAYSRAAPALATAAAGTWAAVTTSNDDWFGPARTPHLLGARLATRARAPMLCPRRDEYFPPAPKNTTREKVVILGSGWAGLNALRKCAGPGKDITVVSPRPHFLYTPLLASSSVGTVGVRSVRSGVRGASTRVEESPTSRRRSANRCANSSPRPLPRLPAAAGPSLSEPTPRTWI